MFRPASLFIGVRYTRAKRRNHFISFMSLTSMAGIALGVLVLITVLSVMNGFDEQIKKRVFSMVPPVTVSSWVGYVENWQSVQDSLEHYPDVTAVAPFVESQALLTHNNMVQPVLLNGILPSAEAHLSELPKKIVQGDLNNLVAGQFGIILGQDLANHLDVDIGDKIIAVTPQMSLTPAGVSPRSKRFTVVGIFHAGSGFGFDMGLAFIQLHDAQVLMQLNQAVTGLHVNIKNIYGATDISKRIAQQLGQSARVTNWTQQYGAFFEAIRLEKTMMFFILMLIIAVAVFNLVCSLVMVVNDKEADIAILRTLGATSPMIMKIFIIQGAIVGITGTLLGVIGGVALAANVTSLVNWLEKVFHVQFLSASVYFVDYLPSQLEWADIIKISCAAITFSLLATLYPAWRATQTEPVEALRYE